MQPLLEHELPGVRERSTHAFQQNPVGELFSSLIFVHLAFSLAAWLALAPTCIATWNLIAVCCWITSRASRRWGGRFLSIAGTLIFLLLTLFFRQSYPDAAPRWLTSGPFSPLGVGFVLILVLMMDLVLAMRLRGLSLLGLVKLCQRKADKIPWKYWGFSFLSLLAIYMIVIPAVDALLEQFREPRPAVQALEEMTFQEAVRLRTTEVFTAVWFFVYGATIGSFVNVIVYRTPRGESIVSKPSTCPQCGTRISGRDNIPVLGWIWLQGKCRSCNLPISARYPIVEAIAGTLFLLFYFVELLSGGQNLPVRNPNPHAGVVWIIFYTKWDLIGLYLFHCYFLTALLTWSLICYDNQRVRYRSMLTTFSLAIIPLLIWPKLMLVSWNPQAATSWRPTIADALTTAGMGLTVGLVAAAVIGCVFHKVSFGKFLTNEREFIAGVALVGCMLGWQAALGLLTFYVIVQAAQLSAAKKYRLDDLKKVKPVGWLLVAAIIQLITWRFQATYMSGWWPVTTVSIINVIGWCTVTFGAALAVPRFMAQDDRVPLSQLARQKETQSATC